MSSPDTTTDRYQRRREAGAASRQDTRRRLVEAADELFRDRGYVATTVAAIAARAGVSVQTVYLAWGSKRDLLRAAGRGAAIESSLPTSSEQWRAIIAANVAAETGDDASALAYLAAVARLFAGVAARTAPYRDIHRQAEAIDPEIVRDAEAMQAERRTTMALVAQGIPVEGLRGDLTQDEVHDTLWALASPEMYDLLIGAGHTQATFEQWLQRTLIAALCA
jgi:AcrR family transcriptional regulator